MTYGDFKDLKRRTASDKVLRYKAFNTAKNLKYDGYQRGITFMVHKFFDKNSKGSGFNIPLEFSEQLAEELHKPINRTVCSRFKDNIWGAALADMQLISKFNKRFTFLLCVIDIFSKCGWVVPLKDKKGVSIVDVSRIYQLIQIKNETKYWLIKEAIHNKGKSVVAERFTRTLKNKIYKYMTSVSKNLYKGKLDDIAGEYNNNIIEQLI